MADLRSAVCYLLRLRIAFTADHLATLAAVPLPRARAFLTQLAADHIRAVTVDQSGVVCPGAYARRWIALHPKTRPGGNATEYRRQREVRAELERLAWLAGRSGALLTSNDDQGQPDMTIMQQAGATTAKATDQVVYTLDQAAIAMQTSRNTVRARVHDGSLRAIRFGRLIRIPATEVERLLAGRAR